MIKIEELFYMLRTNKPYELGTNDPFTVDNWTRLCVSLDYLTQIANYITIPPVGFIYIQLHEQSSPQDLWPSSNWEIISSESYNGAFFRTEGGNAQPFIGQNMPQGDEFKTHSHSYGGIFNGNKRGDGKGDSSRWVDNGSDGHDTQATGGIVDTDGNESPGENRPVNYTIRIWKCIP
jgi:hypothetical protein